MAVASAKLPPLSMEPRSASPFPLVLNSWKDIAAYLKCGVRTAQRWERDLDLPVYRPRPGKRGPVCAFPNEIRMWMRQKRTEHPELAHVFRDNSAITVSHDLSRLSAELVRQTAANTRLQQECAARLLETIRILKSRIEDRSNFAGGGRPKSTSKIR